MQSLLTNIGSRADLTKELSDIQRGTVMGCHLSTKSQVCQISTVVNSSAARC
uniref:Uncharacterized protein n=1 Tax=Anguilla anguilla TaxID=7936 RepID=A0A0E9T1J3_ANGAN